MGYVSNIATNKNRILNHTGLIKEKSTSLDSSAPDEDLMCRAGHIEIQLTDQCVLNCPNCHFRGLGDKKLQFEWLDKVVSCIKPRAITLAGGGEPTIYPRFNEAVLKLAKIPRVKIGLITNGVVYPAGHWTSHILWVRISFYSIENGTYAGKPVILRDVVLKNIDRYLCESGIPNVGIHFLFYRKNMRDILSFAKEIFSRFKDDRENFRKIHIQFKQAFIMARPTNLNQKLHDENKEFLPSIEQLEELLLDFDREFSDSEEFDDFLRLQSNFQIFKQLADGYLDELVGVTNPSNLPIRREDKGKCYVCLAYQLLTPDGLVYPCLTLAEHRHEEFSIGHISEFPSVDIDRLRGFHAAGTECCNKIFCRNWVQNGIVREYIENPSQENIPEDCFF